MMKFMLDIAPRFGVLALSSLMLAAAAPGAHAEGRIVAWGDDRFHEVSDAPKGHNSSMSRRDLFSVSRCDPTVA